MSKIIQEIKDDLSFVKSHTLQPQWYKALKIFILLGFLVGYYFLFGFLKTAVFLVVFILLMFLVHLVYRFKTNKYRKSWLDFIVEQTDEGFKAKSIGKYYYGVIIFNALFSVLISQLF